MSAFKNLLTQAAHRHSSFPKTTQSLLSLLTRHRPFSNQPDPNSSSPRTPVPIQPVSYAVKQPENESPPPPPAAGGGQSPSPPEQTPDIRPETRAWTREDFRYVKDAPSICPVSYPTRVAPLPEDRAASEEVKDEGANDELEKERRRIEFENQNMMRRVLRVEEEKVPFPTLIRSEDDRKKGKVVYDLKEGIQLVKANAKRNFEETFEAHVKLTPELRRTDLKLSGSVLLPHGSGKKFSVAVFAEGDAAEEAREAGAACVGGNELIERIKSGQEKFRYDKCFATREMMNHVLKIAKRLKRGLMPNPDNGTVTNDISRAVREAISQTIIFQKDKSAIVHVPLGKVTYSEEALRENVGAFVNALLQAKPAGLKKSSKYAGYVSTFHICSSMGPSVPVTMQSVSMAVDRYNRLRLLA
ncbi:hypothetical protein ACH5RR_028525 [Cinchona calisaya]|uniref:CL1 n=1 Tax=Cinchona calisaya TaxID=153742 RepID=A0ABD2YSR4_9GENT